MFLISNRSRLHLEGGIRNLRFERREVVGPNAGEGKHPLAAEAPLTADLAKVTGVAAFIEIEVLEQITSQRSVRKNYTAQVTEQKNPGSVASS